MSGTLDQIAGIVLAGGQGRRMGGADKALLMLHGQPLAAHVIARLGCARAISANGPVQRLARFGLPVLPDDLPDHPGPLAGILAGLDWAAGQGFAAIVTAAADTPGFAHDLAARLAGHAAVTGAAVVLARGGSAAPGDGAPPPPPRLQPTFGYWRVDTAPHLRAELSGGTRRVEAAAGILGLAVLDLPGDNDFFNINTPADLALARSLPAWGLGNRQKYAAT